MQLFLDICKAKFAYNRKQRNYWQSTNAQFLLL